MCGEKRLEFDDQRAVTLAQPVEIGGRTLVYGYFDGCG
jgi:hypothetical protein